MSSGRVVVHDVDALEQFMGFLRTKRDELENLYNTLGSVTVNQQDNWQDPQFDYLKDLVEKYCCIGNSQLQELDASIDYIANLVVKLRDI